jgi:2-oxoglutarate dehydrogenase E2 component (dihydrolipoamide succinyltransferase)
MSAPLDIIVPLDQSEGSTARVLRWLRAPGDPVQKDAPLVEIETDKVTVEVAAPATGVLAEILLGEGADAPPGALLARLEPGVVATPGITPAKVASASHAIAPSDVQKTGDDARRELLSPAVRRLLAEHALDAGTIAGSGRDGRITKTDIERHVATAAAAPQATSRRVPHGAMRRRIAEHMAASLATAAHVTAVFEVDLSAVLAHRAAHQADFAGRGAKLTLTAYFVAASAQALKAVPEVNSSFHADALELHTHCNIGVGTALGNEGLIVPVIQRAETLDLYAIARRLGELTAAAREQRLKPDDVRGGTFTISNHGVSGSLIASPVIIHQPQVAILGVGKLEKRVVVREIAGQDAILVRPMCYVTLTIDHRALDGFQSNAFLTKLVEVLEHWPAVG